MSDGPESVLFKLLRAREHIEVLVGEVRDFGEQKPHGAVPKANADRTELTLYLQVRAEPPPIFSLLIGDCVHNLRSALDHLMFHIPRASGTHIRWQRNSQFPLDDAPADFAGHAHYWEGVLPPVVAVLEQLQPYYGGQDPKVHPLHSLRELSNRDKHSLFNLPAHITTKTVVKVPIPPTGTVHGVLTTGGLEDGTVIGKVYYSDPAPPNVDMEINFLGGVTIKEVEPPTGITEALEAIYDKVVDAIARLVPFL